MSSILIQQNIIQLITKTIVNVDFEEPYFKLTDEDQNSYQCQEVLLTIGHQPTQNSKQLKRWSNFSKSKDSITLFENAYPLDQFDDQNKFIEGQIVAIRGFGLSMLDIMRSLTTDRQGSFKTIDDKLKFYNYIDSLQTPQKIIPFSLDGLPLAAKPLTAKIDDQFKPISSDIKFFKEITMRMSKGDFEDELAVQHMVISEIAVNVYSQIENRIYLIRDKQELIQTAYKWLEDEHYTHIVLQDLKKETEVIIDDYVQMALNAKPITLDYCIGQVWRHLQPVWYRWFSHSCVNEDTLKKLIALHERLKRFSYGPPVESMQQLLSLIRFGKVDLRFVKDPEISLTEKGWKLTKNGHIATVPCMINGVLDSPKLLKTNSSLIKGLLANQLIQPVHSKLGIQTNEHALIVRPKNESSIALGVLGRLTIGSIVGTDSLIECFGSRISDWATEAVKRINT